MYNCCRYSTNLLPATEHHHESPALGKEGPSPLILVDLSTVRCMSVEKTILYLRQLARRYQQVCTYIHPLLTYLLAIPGRPPTCRACPTCSTAGPCWPAWVFREGGKQMPATGRDSPRPLYCSGPFGAASRKSLKVLETLPPHSPECTQAMPPYGEAGMGEAVGHRSHLPLPNCPPRSCSVACSGGLCMVRQDGQAYPEAEGETTTPQSLGQLASWHRRGFVP